MNHTETMISVTIRRIKPCYDYIIAKQHYLRLYTLYDHYLCCQQQLPQKTSLNHTIYDLYDY